MASGEAKESTWSVKASRESHDSINPIRQFEETSFQDVLSEAGKRTDVEFIKLSIGKTRHPYKPHQAKHY